MSETSRSRQARKNWLRAIEDEFGIFSSQDVAELWEKGQVVAFRNGSAHRAPAFQFDPAGQVIPAIPRIIAVARNAGWEDQDILVWLTNPNTHFPGARRPVDCLDNADRLVSVLANTIGED